MPWLSGIVSNLLLALPLALAAWVAQRRLRLPAAAHILWAIVLVKLMTPPFVSVPVGQLSGPMACTLGVCSCDHHSLTQLIMRDFLPWVLPAIWAVGAVATALTAWRRSARLRRLLLHAKPARAQWQILAAHIGANLSLRRSPVVLEVPGRMPPMIIPGWRRPRLLLPSALLGQLDVSQRRALLLHELAHIKRGDHWLRMLELAIRVVYWWLPGIGWIGQQLRDCEETCCDAAVIAHIPHARRDYARLLLDVLDFVNPLPTEAMQQATAMSAGDLEQRLRAILDTNHRAHRIGPVGALIVGLACAILPCELHYDWINPSAVNAIGCEQSEEERCAPAGARESQVFKSLCCPS